MRAHVILRLVWIIAAVAVLLFVWLPRHKFDKYRCAQPDGSTTFQDHPCPSAVDRK